MQENLAVYTVLMGGDYDLPPIIPTEGVDYICFSDQEGLEPNGWIVRPVLPTLPTDTFRSSRDMKIRPHRWLADYQKSIYIDTTVHLSKNPIALWEHLMPHETTLFGGFFHSFRDTVAEEFIAVTDRGLDYKHVIKEQLRAFREHHNDILDEKPLWGGILARKHNEEKCIYAMEVWYAHVLRYSRRDQLSLPLALSFFQPNQANISSDDNHVSDFHKWPVRTKPKPPGYRVEKVPFHKRESYKTMLKKARKLRKSLKKRVRILSGREGSKNIGD